MVAKKGIELTSERSTQAAAGSNFEDGRKGTGPPLFSRPVPSKTWGMIEMTLLLLSWTKIPTAPTLVPPVRHVGGLLFPEEILIELNVAENEQAAGVIGGINGAKCEFGIYGKL